ncbi:hypothetical protein [Roseivirga sp. E12]|uniref:hypothetical protein n=1 Tax=Roseivirga sp. E12 TaxID=2819237 RepID=UPI001ABCD5D2|nr:hypothetical protein [Roseivirga sp. E12]MBO3697285.1 hypothetical protein [Roseivirga sp. E12]
MEILKTSTQWAKDEVFSSVFFILFGVLFILATIGFWQLGKTEVARAFIYPTLVAGSLLLMAGISFTMSNKKRLSDFETEYNVNPSAFIKAEIARTEKTMWEYKNIAMKVLPLIVVVAALLIVFIDKPIWRAISMTLIAMLLCMISIDSLALSRMKKYHKELKQAESQHQD